MHKGYNEYPLCIYAVKIYNTLNAIAAQASASASA